MITINRNSWHCRFICWIHSTYPQRYDFPKDICSYRSYFFAGVLKLLLLVFAVVVILGGLGLIVYKDPVVLAITIAVVITAVVVILSITAAIDYLSNVSITSQMYQSWKDKWCTKIEVE